MVNRLVSVIIPSYNRASTVERSVQSVLNQTYQHLEIIFVDDGSTDGTRSVIESIKDSRLHYVFQPNAGACAARNRGVQEAHGEYIAFQDSDDTWHPEKLERQIRELLDYQADLVFCRLLAQDPSGDHVYPRHILPGDITLQDDLFGIGTQSILAKRRVLEAEAFDPEMPRYQDLEWLFRVVRRFKIRCMDEALVNYCIGEDSISVNQEKMYTALNLFSEKYSSFRRQCPLLFMHIVRNLMEGGLLAFQRKTGWSKFIQLALRCNPGLLRYLRARNQNRMTKSPQRRLSIS